MFNKFPYLQFWMINKIPFLKFWMIKMPYFKKIVNLVKFPIFLMRQLGLPGMRLCVHVDAAKLKSERICAEIPRKESFQKENPKTMEVNTKRHVKCQQKNPEQKKISCERLCYFLL